jgi:uncharacterized protein YbjT (DUF2867 family)
MNLLIGAPGNIGSHAARELLSRGAPVRALAVDENAATQLRELGVTDVVIADLRRPEDLPAVFAGVERLLLITPYVPDQTVLETNAIRAAADAGVRRVVKLSPTHADTGRYPKTPANSAAHVASEQILAGTGIETTIVRAEAFATNLLAQVPLIAQGMVVYPHSSVRMTWTDNADIGAVLAAATLAAEHVGDVVWATGPEDLTFAELADRIGTAVGRRIRYVDIDPQAWRDQLVAAGLPQWWADALVEMFAAYRDHGPVVSGDVERLLGRPPHRIDRFLHEQLAPAVQGAVATADVSDGGEDH